MEKQHTPGEWIITSGKNPVIRAGKNGFVIAEVTKSGITHFIGNEAEAEANARLIATAPELLESLEQAFNEIVSLNNILYKRNIYDLEISAVRQKQLIEQILRVINKAYQL